MYRVLTRIVEGNATMQDVEMLKQAAGQIEGHTAGFRLSGDLAQHTAVDVRQRPIAHRADQHMGLLVGHAGEQLIDVAFPVGDEGDARSRA